MNEALKVIAGILYAGAAIILIPWTHYLWRTLPTKHNAERWRNAWVGFDIALLCSLLATGVLLLVNSVYVVIAAVVASTLLLADAWFDYMTATHTARRHALLMALVLEIPLALVTISMTVLYLQDFRVL